MSDDQFVTVFVNCLGDKKYQPTLPDGRRCYTYTGIDGWFLGEVWVLCVYSSRYKDKLYRSKSRAIRVAKREYKRRERINFVQEV